MAQEPLAIVTGGAHRLGKVFALALAQAGFAILLHYWSAETEAQATADEIRALGVPAYLFRGDLARADTAASMMAFVDTLPHPLMVLVNSAGVIAPGDIRTLSSADWNAVLDLNLRAPFLCAQQAARRMKPGGLIVNVSDVGAQKTWTRFPAYSVSKAGLDALTRLLARALAPDIRVNAIAPGLALPTEGVSGEEWQRLVGRVPMKRAAETAELAQALDFLVRNEYVSGQTLVVDGGYSLLA